MYNVVSTRLFSFGNVGRAILFSTLSLLLVPLSTPRIFSRHGDPNELLFSYTQKITEGMEPGEECSLRHTSCYESPNISGEVAQAYCCPLFPSFSSDVTLKCLDFEWELHRMYLFKSKVLSQLLAQAVQNSDLPITETNVKVKKGIRRNSTLVC